MANPNSDEKILQQDEEDKINAYAERMIRRDRLGTPGCGGVTLDPQHLPNPYYDDAQFERVFGKGNK